MLVENGAAKPVITYEKIVKEYGGKLYGYARVSSDVLRGTKAIIQERNGNCWLQGDTDRNDTVSDTRGIAETTAIHEAGLVRHDISDVSERHPILDTQKPSESRNSNRKEVKFRKTNERKYTFKEAQKVVDEIYADILQIDVSKGVRKSAEQQLWKDLNSKTKHTRKQASIDLATHIVETQIFSDNLTLYLEQHHLH